MLDVVKLICDLAGTGMQPEAPGKGTPSGEIDREWIDFSKLSRLNRVAADHEPRRGLRRTIEWYRAHSLEPAISRVAAAQVQMELA